MRNDDKEIERIKMDINWRELNHRIISGRIRVNSDAIAEVQDQLLRMEREHPSCGKPSLSAPTDADCEKIDVDVRIES